MGCGGSKAVSAGATPEAQTLTDEQDPIGFFAEEAAVKRGEATDPPTIAPIVKGKCERCGEDVLDTQQRDRTEAGNYIHLLPDNCPVLAQEANWQHRKSTFEEEVLDDTQAPTQKGSQQVDTYNRPKNLPSEEAENETEYVALDVTLQNKAEQETYATFEPGG